MKVLRLEYKHLKEVGPFAEIPTWGLMAAGVPGVSVEVVPPAEVAQYVAITLGQQRPYRLRPVRDDIPASRRKEMSDFVAKAGDKLLNHGFASMKQYREWFSTPEQRAALFANTTFDRNDTTKYNDLELRCFEVPDDKVFVADHQVLFSLDDVISSKAVSRKEAIA